MKFLGAVTDRTGFYHALDALFYRRCMKGFLMALLEAMASGCPAVLASRLEGIAAALAEGEEGLLAEAGAIEDFSEQAGASRKRSRPAGKTGLKAARAKRPPNYSATRTAYSGRGGVLHRARYCTKWRD